MRFLFLLPVLLLVGCPSGDPNNPGDDDDAAGTGTEFGPLSITLNSFGPSNEHAAICRFAPVMGSFPYGAGDTAAGCSGARVAHFLWNENDGAVSIEVDDQYMALASASMGEVTDVDGASTVSGLAIDDEVTLVIDATAPEGITADPLITVTVAITDDGTTRVAEVSSFYVTDPPL